RHGLWRVPPYPGARSAVGRALTSNGLLAVVATAVTLVFWGMLLERHRGRPRPATLSWLVGLGCYAVGVGCQALGELGALDPVLYRLWYLAGAFFAAAYLGGRSLFLIDRPRLAGWAMRGLVWASILV